MADIGAASSSGGAQKPSLSMMLNAIKNGLFGTLYVMQKKHSNVPALTLIALFVKWLQFMAFALQNEESHWEKSTIAPIKILSLVPTASGWFRVITTPYVYLALFSFSFAWVVAFLGLMAWAMRSFTKGEIGSLWPIRLLAAIGTFSASVAFIPLITVLLSTFQCDTHELPFWQDAGYVCYSGVHLAISVIAGILAVFFVINCALFALVFYESHPLSSNLGGKSHGRVDFLFLIMKTLLVVTIDVLPTKLGSQWAIVGINIGAGCAWVAMIYTFMPYTQHLMNRLFMSCGTAYLYAGICLAVQTGQPQWGAAPAAFLYIGLPTAFLAGIYLADYRRRSIMAVPVSKMASPFDVDIKARYLLQGAVSATLAASAAEANAVGKGPDDVDTTSSPQSGGQQLERKGSRAGGLARKPSGTLLRKPSFLSGPRSAREGTSGNHHHVNAPDAAGSSDAGLLVAAFKAMDAEQRATIVRSRLPKAIVDEAEALFRTAVISFPTSAILHIFQARFYHVYRADKHLHMSHLLQVTRLQPAIDVDYLAFSARRSAEAEGSGSGNAQSGMTRVAFEKHLADARTCTLKAAQAQVQFWAELSDLKPDIARLSQLATQLHKYTQEAEAHFHELFSLNPQSLAALRLFAQYNVCVANNTEKASAISAEADRIEDQKNKDNQSAGGGGLTSGAHSFKSELPLELMADATASITVGASSRDLGMILSCNAATCKLFGYTRLQLERRNVSILIPSPYAELHDSIMRRYISTGEGKLLETVRVMLAQHRNGTIFPMLILIRTSHSSDGQQTFNALIRTVTSSEQFLMMDEDYRIRAASAGALMVLGLEAATLASSEVYVQDYISTFDDPDVHKALRTRAMGEVIRIRAPGMSFNPASASSSGGSGNGDTGNGNTSGRRGSLAGGSRSDDGGGDRRGARRNSVTHPPRRNSIGATPDSVGGDGSPRAGSGAAGTGTGHVDDGYVFVRASLNTSNSRAVTTHIMSWRNLSANEQAQRTQSARERSGSIASASAGNDGHHGSGSAAMNVHGGENQKKSKSAPKTTKPSGSNNAASADFTGIDDDDHEASPERRRTLTGTSSILKMSHSGSRANMHMSDKDKEKVDLQGVRFHAEHTVIELQHQNEHHDLPRTPMAASHHGEGRPLHLPPKANHHDAYDAATPTVIAPISTTTTTTKGRGAAAVSPTNIISPKSMAGMGIRQVDSDAGTNASVDSTRANHDGPASGIIAPSPFVHHGSFNSGNSSNVNLSNHGNGNSRSKMSMSTGSFRRGNSSASLKKAESSHDLYVSGAQMPMPSGHPPMPRDVADDNGSDGGDYEVSLGAQLTQCPVMRAPAGGTSSSLRHGRPDPMQPKGSFTSGGRVDAGDYQQQQQGYLHDHASVTGHESLPDNNRSAGFEHRGPGGTAVIRKVAAASHGPAGYDHGDHDDDRKSEGQSSHGSSSKMSMGRATFGKLRRALADVKNSKQRSAGLRRLWFVGYGLILVNIALASVAAAVLDQSFASYAVNLEFAQFAARSTASMFRALRLVHERTLYTRGVYPATYETEVANQVELSHQADLFSNYQHEMFDLASGSIVEDEFTSPTVRSINYDDIHILAPHSLTHLELDAQYEGDTLWFFSDAGFIYQGKQFYTSALDFGFRLAGMMKQWSTIPIGAATYTAPIARAIVDNCMSGSSFNDRVMGSIMSAYRVSVETKMNVQQIAFYIFICMGPLLLGLLILFVTPILFSLERSRDDVIERFLDVPALVVATLRTQAERRLKGLRTEDEDDVSADDEDDLDNPNGNNDANSMDDDDDDAGFDWDSLFQRAAIEHSRAEKHALKKLLRQGGVDPTAAKKLPQSRRSSVADPSTSATQQQLISPHLGASNRHLLAANNSPATAASSGIQLSISANAAVRRAMNPFGTDDDLGSSTATTSALRGGLGASTAAGGTTFTGVNPMISMGSSSQGPSSTALAPLYPTAAANSNVNSGLDPTGGFNTATVKKSTRLATKFQPTESAFSPSVLGMTLGCSNSRSRSIYNPDGSISHQRRQFRKGGRSMLKLCAFQLPVLCIFAFYLALYMVTLDTLSTVITLSTYTAMANTRTTSLLAASSATFSYMSSQGYDNELDRLQILAVTAMANLRHLQAALGFSKSQPDDNPALDELTDTDLDLPTIPEGSESTFIPGVAPSVFTEINSAMFGDACPVIHEVSPASVSIERCRALADGVFSAGLHAGLHTFMVDMASLRRRREAATLPYNQTDGVGVLTTVVAGVPVVEHYSLLSEFNSTSFKRVDDLRLNVFKPVFEHIGERYQQAGQAAVDGYRRFLVISVAAFVSLFTVGMLVIYVPAIRIVSADLHAKRCLLMTIPAPVVIKVPSLRNLVLDIVSESDGGGKRKSDQQELNNDRKQNDDSEHDGGYSSGGAMGEDSRMSRNPSYNHLDPGAEPGFGGRDRGNSDNLYNQP